MTKSEAIEEFQQNIELPFGCTISDEASQMAIKALEKQIEMEKYCDEQGCLNCPYHNPSLKECMNDFIIESE